MANGPPLDTMIEVMSPVKVEPAAKATPVDDVPLTEMVIVPPVNAVTPSKSPVFVELETAMVVPASPSAILDRSRDITLRCVERNLYRCSVYFEQQCAKAGSIRAECSASSCASNFNYLRFFGCIETERTAFGQCFPTHINV
jgi:hypothetical protein